MYELMWVKIDAKVSFENTTIGIDFQLPFEAFAQLTQSFFFFAIKHNWMKEIFFLVIKKLQVLC